MNHRITAIVKSTILLVSICLVILSPLPGTVQPALAFGETITVTTTVDEYDSEIYPAGECSLREAITAANNNASYGGCIGGVGDDTITFEDLVPGSPETYLLTRIGSEEDLNVNGDLDILSNLTISGNGQTGTIIDGLGLGDRILDVHDNRILSLENLTLTRGHAENGANGTSGGNGDAGRSGGALFARLSTTLELTRVTVSLSHAGDGGNGDFSSSSSSTGGNGGAGGTGGGIYQANGLLTINDSDFWENSAGDSGSGGAGAAGSAGFPGTAGSSGGWGRSGANGGAIFIEYDGILSITNTNFTDNSAGDSGNGGNGGAGGAGSNGGAGAHGGNGGIGGNGGASYGGGAGGAIYTNAHTVIHTSYFTGNGAGNAGTAGAGGMGGAGGDGGSGSPAPVGGWGGNGGNGGNAFSGGAGGAISSGAALEIHGSEFNGNSSGYGGIGGAGGNGGAAGKGGAASSAGIGGVGGSGGNGGIGQWGGSGGDGGAVQHRNQTLIVENSTFLGNFTGYGRSAGIGGSGGNGGNGGTGLSAAGGNGGVGGSVAFNGSSGSGGSGGDGGALSLEASSTAILTNVTISGNTASTSAGGAAGGNGGNGGNGGSGSPQGNGGNGGYGSSGGNGGFSGYGAGISLPFNSAGTALTLSFDTIVQNVIAIPSGSGGSAGVGGDGGIGFISGTDGLSGIPGTSAQFGLGGGISREKGSVTLSATILAENLADGSYDNCYSRSSTSFTSGGWNLIGSNVTYCPLIVAEGDIFNVSGASLHLGSLALNWRSPLTHALLPGSLAIDWVTNGEANCDTMTPTDARGMRRPINANCDVGAFEVGNMGFLPLIKK